MERERVTVPTPRVAPPIVRSALAAPGRALDADLQAEVTPRFGFDFRRVRVHDDQLARDSAREVGALAYTVGTHVVLGATGRHVLLHELAHVVQQRDHAGTHVNAAIPVGDVDSSHEAEADAAGHAVAHGNPAPRLGTHRLAVQRQARPALPAPVPALRSYPLDTPADLREMIAGSFASDPEYLDNYTGGGYELLTDLFRLVYPSRIVDLRYGDVRRQLAAPAAGEAHTAPPLPAAADPAGGSRYVTLSETFYYRSRQTGLIHPVLPSRATLPHLATAIDHIEAQRPTREHEIIMTWIDGAVAVHGVANGTVASSRLADELSTLRSTRPAPAATRRPPRPEEPVQISGGSSRERQMRTRMRPANDNAATTEAEAATGTAGGGRRATRAAAEPVESADTAAEQPRAGRRRGADEEGTWRRDRRRRDDREPPAELEAGEGTNPDRTVRRVGGQQGMRRGTDALRAANASIERVYRELQLTQDEQAQLHAAVHSLNLDYEGVLREALALWPDKAHLVGR